VNPSADLLLVNGHVLTMDRRQPHVDAIAVAGDRVLAVGATDELTNLATAGTTLVDLRGRTLLPGLIDSHCHLSKYGLLQDGFDCKAHRITSIEDLQQGIAALAGTRPPGSWIRARGYDQTRLAERRHPTRWDLDAAAPEHPVYLVRTCGHIGVASSRALALAGVGEDTPDPPGGHFERVDGHLTGLMYEGAQGPVVTASRASADEMAMALAAAERAWLQAGVTTAVDCGGVEGHVQGWQRRHMAGQLRLRVTLAVLMGLGRQQGQAFLDSELFTGFGDDRLRIGPFKVMVDGSSSGPTAATREPYCSLPDYHGQLNVSQDELDVLFGDAHRAGFQVTMHGVGDRAIEIGLNAIERALREAGPARIPHRIEHCAMAPKDIRRRLQVLGVLPVAQPYFFWEFGDGYLLNYGVDRGGSMFPIRSFLADGIDVAGSSDAPVSAHEPLRAIQSAMTRQTMDGQVAGPHERVDLMDALRMYTINGARATGEDAERGSLEPGKLADLVVLGGDLAATPVEEVGALPVDLTIVGGEVVYSAAGS
jgi:predicted amidohydrolase YtcJ